MGAEVDLVRPEEVMHHVTHWVNDGGRRLVANHNAHSLYLMRREPKLNDFFRRADLIEVDSTPIIVFTRLLGLSSRIFHRCTYLDWRPHFWSVANRSGWRVFYLGGAPGVPDKAQRRLAARYPGAVIDVRHGYFDAAEGSAENEAVLRQIAAFRPDILFVGMGMPRQELWILRNFERLPPCVLFSVGAAFDYEAGVQRPAPRWVGRAGLEWAFRLATSPRRLARRYCIEPWHLIGPAMQDLRLAVREGRLLASPASRRTAARSGRSPDPVKAP